MNAASFWESFLWTKWAKPVSRRRLYQRIQRGAPIRIVEFGLGDGQRAERMLRLAARYSDQRIQYCGIDLFEAREHDPLPLKKVHNKLAATGAKVRLVPGDLFAALGRTANLLTQTDLLVIDEGQSAADLESAHPFLPRMLHEDSSIARFDFVKDRSRLRWIKPSTFLKHAKAA